MEGHDSKAYPKASYPWRLYRSEFLQMPWSNVKASLLELKRLNKLPKRLHEKSSWWWAKYWMKRYCALLGKRRSFRVGSVKGMGLGVFANKEMKKGAMLMFGHLHRVSHKTVLTLDKLGESSLMQVKRGKRSDWYYLGGPASLINHACKNFNAEYILDEDDRRGSHGEMLVTLTRAVAADEELLVHYGTEFWKQEKCKCSDCFEKGK
jgi:hypothetical protein